MNRFSLVLAAFLGSFFIALLASLVGGTVVYWLWPLLIPVFHIPGLTWSQAVALVWILHVIFPRSIVKSEK